MPQHNASIGRGGNGAIFLVRRRGSPPDSIKFAEKRAHKLCVTRGLPACSMPS